MKEALLSWRRIVREHVGYFNVLVPTMTDSSILLKNDILSPKIHH